MIRLSAALFSALLLGAGAAGATGFANHLAVYDIHLQRADEQTGISDVSGRMVVELTGSECEGWSVGFRMVNRFATSDGDPARMIDLQSTSWESPDGREMHYSEREFVNNDVKSDFRLTAKQPASGKPIEVLEGPEADPTQIPAEVVFPMTHQRRLLDAALAGKRFDRSLVFDGSEGAKFYTVITFIGREQKGKALPGKFGQRFEGMRMWPMVISYYEDTNPKEGESVPSHQIIMQIYENGVSGNLALDYGDLRLTGEVREVELKEAKGSCP